MVGPQGVGLVRGGELVRVEILNLETRRNLTALAPTFGYPVLLLLGDFVVEASRPAAGNQGRRELFPIKRLARAAGDGTNK